LSEAAKNLEAHFTCDANARTSGLLGKLCENLHFAVSVLLGAVLFAALFILRLPLRFDWPEFFVVYWVGFGLRSIFFAVVLCVIGLPREQTVQPLWRRYWSDKRRLLFFVPVVVELFWLLGLGPGLVCSVAVVAFIELLARSQERRVPLSSASAAVAVPAVYLFAGLILVMIYNDLVVSLKYYGAFDDAFNRMDLWLLGGKSVPDMAHWALRHLSARAVRFLEFVYFGMFSQVGAGIVLTGIACGRKRAIQYVGTLVTAYYLALLLFFLWPSQGPYYLCATHFSEYPGGLQTCLVQQHLLENARAVWGHGMRGGFGLDYFIAFPSMHVALVLIVLWYLRRWKRMVAFLIVMDLLIVFSTMLLEWHYVVDLIGGAIVALLAVGMVDGWGRKPQPSEVAPLGTF
jgi:membrane-associated phospholipid phosphatase